MQQRFDARAARVWTASLAASIACLVIGVGGARAQDEGVPTPPAPATQPEMSTTVSGSQAQRLRESSQAVTVVETKQARRQNADLGEVLARSEGVGVRRGGGLGSSTRLSLNGLTDDQIRFFIDGLPLEFAGYPFGISNVPVNLVDRVEVYRGVVPVRFGADALGGIVNLVTEPPRPGLHGAASYQLGSYDTHRLTLSGSYRALPSGLFVRASGFFDDAGNDYPVDVQVADDLGRLSDATLDRFHDRYRATGGSVEGGVIGRPWARRLVARAFIANFSRDLQHDVNMSVPYGEVTLGRTGVGGTLTYGRDFAHGLKLDGVVGYGHERTRLFDVATCVYDWYGRCVGQRAQGGEIEGEPHDQIYWAESVYGRVNLSWRPRADHELRLSIAPTFVTRTGDERRQRDPDAFDPLAKREDLFTLVTGVEHEGHFWGDRLENTLFAKAYFQLARADEPLAGGFSRNADQDTTRVGVGDSLRFRFREEVWAKVSYEWATRLPRPDEIFGDGLLVRADYDLAPERSHNANAGVNVDARDTLAGDFRLSVNGFLREASQLIVLLGNDQFFGYHNVFSARSFGVETAGGWTSPGRYLALDGNATFQDFRNTSDEGTFASYDGDRVPNRPWIFANAAARLQLSDFGAPRNELSLAFTTRFVHAFFRTWESEGIRKYKQRVPSQLVHGLALTYLAYAGRTRLSWTAEVLNLTDEDAFDFFGVQRPGRAFYAKVTAEL